MNAKKIILLLAVLLIGGFIGFFISGRLAKQRIRDLHEMASQPGREAGRLFRVLDLDSAQREQVRPILQKHMPAHRQIRLGFQRQMDSLRAEMFNELAPLLTPKQQMKLEELRNRPFHPPPPPRRPYRDHNTR